MGRWDITANNAYEKITIILLCMSYDLRNGLC